MNPFGLSLAYLRARPWTALLNVTLLALGVATLVLLYSASTQMQERLTRDARGIDLVVGAKGSPLQLILASIYHLDAPTGNIALEAAEKLRAHPMVKRAVPLALGDSVGGIRIVGTEFTLVDLYGGRLREGRAWKVPLEATLGAQAAATLGLKLGDRFVGSHGIGAGGEAHADSPYQVVGVLEPTGTVLDRLALTSVESVWAVHADHPTAAAPPAPDHDQAQPERKEITALLIQYASPLAAALLPRTVNAEGALQAASPAFETARLFNLLGIGLDALRLFALVLIVAALLSTFLALTQALEGRLPDLLLLRLLGASRRSLFIMLLTEALLIGIAGALLGVALGHGALAAVARLLTERGYPPVTAGVVGPFEVVVAVAVIAMAALAALIPAWRAYRLDPPRALARLAQ